MRVQKKCLATLAVLEGAQEAVVEHVLMVVPIAVLAVVQVHVKEDAHILALMDVKEVAVVTKLL